MSRVGDYDGEESFNNEWAFWQRRIQMVLTGKRGRKLLGELREALEALPEKRLIANALRTVGENPDAEEHQYDREDCRDLLERQGEGVCAVGAFAWYQRVKAGMDPDEAFRSLPYSPDYDGDYETITVGEKAGLGQTLAWVLMDLNDGRYEALTPEARYEAVMQWIDEKLSASAQPVGATQ